MFKWVKNQFLAKMQVEKFISTQYVKFVNSVIELLENDNLSKEDVIKEITVIRDTIIERYKLTEKDIED